MKILILAESLRINNTSSGIVSSTFIQALKEEGNEITCMYENSVSTKISWLKGVKLIPVIYKKIKKNIIDRIPKVNAINTYLKGIHKDNEEKIKAWVISINELLSKDNFDLIIVLGSGSSFLPHYAMLKIDTKIPWVANFHDPYPMSLYPEPYKAKKNLIYKKQEKFAKQIIEKANFVSFPSLYLKEWMQQFFPKLEKKSVILPHIGFKLDNLPSVPIDDQVLLSKKKFNLLHAGSLLGPRKVETLFKAFVKFIEKDKERQEKSILTILGKVAKEHKEIEQSVKKISSNIVVIPKRVSYKKSLQLITDSDVSLVIEADASISPFMPGKLADLILLEKPILALTPKKSETLRVLGENYPYKAKVNDQKQIEDILELLWKDWKTGHIKCLDYTKQKKYISSKQFNKKITKLI